MKYIKPTILILVIIFIFGSGYYYFFSPYGQINTYFRVENFKKYEEDYQNVCNEIIYMLKENNLLDDKKHIITIGAGGVLESGVIRRKLSQSNYKSLQTIKKSFPIEHGYEFSYAFYHKNMIFLGCENGSYAIVYSVQNEKPSFWPMDYPYNNKFNTVIKTKKITENWYHVWR